MFISFLLDCLFQSILIFLYRYYVHSSQFTNSLNKNHRSARAFNVCARAAETSIECMHCYSLAWRPETHFMAPNDKLAWRYHNTKWYTARTCAGHDGRIDDLRFTFRAICILFVSVCTFVIHFCLYLLVRTGLSSVAAWLPAQYRATNDYLSN